MLLGASVLLTLVLTEPVLRHSVVPVETPYHFERGAVIADPSRGFRLAPNQHTIMSNGHFREEVVTNTDGFRDLFDPVLPDPGVIAIGDSQTFGHGLPAQQSWPEQLQRQLGVNVVNTGVFGYDLSQYIYVLRDLVAKGHPIRLVLYAMSWNDVTSASDPPDSSTVDDGYLVENPKYKTLRAGQLSWLERLREQPIVLRLSDNTALGRLAVIGGRRLFSVLGLSPSPSIDRDLANDIEVTKRGLLELRAFLEPMHAELLVVHIGDPNFVMPEIWDDYHRRHAHPRDIAARSFAAWGAPYQIHFRDAIDSLQRRYVESGRQRTSILLPVNPHYGAGGQRVIAEVFRQAIEDDGLGPLLGGEPAQPRFDVQSRSSAEVNPARPH